MRALAGRHAQRLGTLDDAQLADYAFTANTGRSHFAEPAALPATSAAGAAQSLAAFAAAEPAAGVVRGEVTNVDRPRIAFLFTGQGAQYAGMGRGLYETQPVFREALDRCAAVLDAELGRPLLPLMFGGRRGPEPDRVDAAGALCPGVCARADVELVGHRAVAGARPQRRRVHSRLRRGRDEPRGRPARSSRRAAG